MKRAAADALAGLVQTPVPERIIPGAFDPGVAEAVAAEVRRVAVELGHVRS
jgi:malate dehydrogenase (oxaloacetate-decarboxylating)